MLLQISMPLLIVSFHPVIFSVFLCCLNWFKGSVPNWFCTVLSQPQLVCAGMVCQRESKHVWCFFRFLFASSSRPSTAHPSFLFITAAPCFRIHQTFNKGTDFKWLKSRWFAQLIRAYFRGGKRRIKIKVPPLPYDTPGEVRFWNEDNLILRLIMTTMNCLCVFVLCLFIV